MTKNKTKRSKDGIEPYLFVLPFVVSFILFFMIPSAYSFVLSFYKYNGYSTATFVGFRNYFRIFGYWHFWESLVNTLVFYVGHFIPVFVIPFLLALALGSQKTKFRGLYQTLVFLPNIVSLVASALVFRILLGTRSGVINSLIGAHIPFLEDAIYMKMSVISLMVWHGFGWFFIVFLAGLTTVSEELKEAASIDGAKPYQVVLHITIPIMKPVFLFAIVMDMISTLKLFVEPQLLLGTSSNAKTIPQAGDTIITLLYDNLNNGVYGTASAIGWILFLIILGVSILQFRVLQVGED
jgi:ABC-type sugar transport system permease subunit